MTAEPEFLTVADVLAIHRGQMVRYRGHQGVRDLALLESAVASPQATFERKYLHRDLFAMAAAYAFHIAQNQPFVDGNKRTGLLSALVFLDINGVPIDTGSVRLYDAMIGVAEGRIDKADLADVFRALANPNISRAWFRRRS